VNEIGCWYICLLSPTSTSHACFQCSHSKTCKTINFALNSVSMRAFSTVTRQWVHRVDSVGSGFGFLAWYACLSNIRRVIKQISLCETLLTNLIYFRRRIHLDRINFPGFRFMTPFAREVEISSQFFAILPLRICIEASRRRVCLLCSSLPSIWLWFSDLDENFWLWCMWST
jgi:hypothetical protein